jgi:putative Mg2+ transporter-C (MgtC) family protein
MSAADLDQVLRLVVAAVVGTAIGFNRELRGKPLGMRTLALVALGSAVVALAGLDFLGTSAPPGAIARVLQGVITGVLSGIGFIGAGVVLHDRDAATVHGLTTAATVWMTAALGIACALAAWTVTATGIILALAVLFGLNWVERRFMTED